MDLTALRREVESLVARAVQLDERYPYADRDAMVETMIDTANTLDDVDRIITGLYEQVTAALDRAGAVYAECANGCGHLVVQPATGRPRRTCSVRCRVAVCRS